MVLTQMIMLIMTKKIIQVEDTYFLDNKNKNTKIK